VQEGPLTLKDFNFVSLPILIPGFY